MQSLIHENAELRFFAQNRQSFAAVIFREQHHVHSSSSVLSPARDIEWKIFFYLLYIADACGRYCFPRIEIIP